jgi:hypothetical protein
MPGLRPWLVPDNPMPSASMYIYTPRTFSEIVGGNCQKGPPKLTIDRWIPTVDKYNEYIKLLFLKLPPLIE